MIAFRADINKEIASGHIMRSIAIAKKVREKGEEVLFISGDDYCSNFLNPCGFDYVTTNSPADSFDDELPLMKSLVDKYDIKCLFVDSYVVSAHYLCEMNKICKVAFIDDYLKEKLDISLLLAPTQSRSLDFVSDMYKDTDTVLLLGKDYLIIRDEFLSKEPLPASQTENILITTGGTDKYSFTLKLMRRIISEPLLFTKHYFIILGALNGDEDAIRSLAFEHKDTFSILKNISNMGFYMKQSAYAVSAGGNTVYELLCCKVPLSVIALSDDQEALGKRLSEKHILSYEGDCRNDVDEVTENCVRTLLSVATNGIKHDTKKAVENFTDGLGASRIADALINLCK